MKRIVLQLLLFTALTSMVVRSQAQEEKHNYRPKNGLVPTREVATRIAGAVWEPIYGKENIQNQRPFRAALKDGIWIVKGRLKQGRRGGVALAEISKHDARVIRISHGR